MKKAIIFSLVLMLFCFNAYANVGKVGPEYWVYGKVDNQTPINWDEIYTFSDFTQAIDVYGNSTNFEITMIKGDRGQFYLNYIVDLNFPNSYFKRLCKFDVDFVSGHFRIRAYSFPQAFVNCIITGSDLTNDLTIHIAMK